MTAGHRYEPPSFEEMAAELEVWLGRLLAAAPTRRSHVATEAIAAGMQYRSSECVRCDLPLLTFTQAARHLRDSTVEHVPGDVVPRRVSR